jgi:uncharacterized protein (DUF58 family)
MYLRKRFYLIALAIILVMIAGRAWLPLLWVGQGLLALLVAELIAETVVLWFGGRIEGSRTCADRFSNGDDNEVRLRVKSHYRMPVWLSVTDEAPVVFQRRDIAMSIRLKPATGRVLTYRLRPVRRGVYQFGRMRVFTSVLLRCMERRFTLGEAQKIKVYPSYLMLRHYELLAFSQRLTEMGIKRIRRPGNNTEFEQIKDYVKGDDYRAINWKATARTSRLMVNVYNEERSQQVFCVIDKGRLMQQTSQCMTYLDWAINAALVLSFVSIHREDKAGLITFGGKVDTFLPADRHAGQMQAILESLYRQQTEFDEADYAALVTTVGQRVQRRSLLVVFTNFATVDTARRQLPYLRQLARRHRVLVVFFRDEELEAFVQEKPTTEEGYFQRVTAEREVANRQLVASMLRQYGMETLLVRSHDLSISVLNKYLAMRH